MPDVCCYMSDTTVKEDLVLHQGVKSKKMKLIKYSGKDCVSSNPYMTKSAHQHKISAWEQKQSHGVLRNRKVWYFLQMKLNTCRPTKLVEKNSF